MHEPSAEVTVLVALIGGSVAKLIFGAITRKNRRQKMVKVGTVTQLNIYPVKSCQGISIQEASCTHLGLRVGKARDRHWLVVRSNGDFVTMRQMPKMALVQTEIRHSQLVLNASGMPTLSLPLEPMTDRGAVIRCRVWEERVEGLDCGDDAAFWFSTLLRTPGLRLVYAAADIAHQDLTRTKKTWGNPSLPGDQTAFSDWCGYMVMTEESLQALNDKLQNKVTMRQFRPNLVIKGSPAFNEDNWSVLQVGESATFRMLDPCTRCLLTTINPDTGERDPKGEPLETLRSMRCFPLYGTSPIFGVNATLDDLGEVRVGDEVWALRKRE